MDRNLSPVKRGFGDRVALRKESVDRNEHAKKRMDDPTVALRKESVDRNIRNRLNYTKLAKSLSARRAWIEISKE